MTTSKCFDLPIFLIKSLSARYLRVRLQFEIVSLGPNAVFVAYQKGLERMIQASSFAYIEPWIFHIYRQIENDLFLKTLDWRDAFFKIRLRRQLRLGLRIASV